MKKEAAQLKKEMFVDVFDETRCGRYQRFIWDLMEKPHTSIAAKVIANLNNFVNSIKEFLYFSRKTVS